MAITIKRTLMLPRGIEVDIYNPPKDFDEQIRKSFEEFTKDTRKEFMYQDKLLYIDYLNEYVHGIRNLDSYTMAENFAKEKFAYYLEEEGEFFPTEDYSTLDSLSEAVEYGREHMLLYGHYGDYASYERVMELMARAIKVVMNFEYDEVEE